MKKKIVLLMMVSLFLTPSASLAEEKSVVEKLCEAYSDGPKFEIRKSSAGSFGRDHIYASWQFDYDITCLKTNGKVERMIIGETGSTILTNGNGVVTSVYFYDAKTIRPLSYACAANDPSPICYSSQIWVDKLLARPKEHFATKPRS